MKNKNSTSEEVVVAGKDFWVFDDVLEGLAILRRYCSTERSIQSSVQGMLWAGSKEANPKKLRDVDFERLENLGWFWLEQRSCWAINL